MLFLISYLKAIRHLKALPKDLEVCCREFHFHSQACYDLQLMLLTIRPYFQVRIKFLEFELNRFKTFFAAFLSKQFSPQAKRMSEYQTQAVFSPS